MELILVNENFIQSMLLVYTPNITNRVRYTFNLVLKELLAISYEFTIEKDEFVQFNGPKLNYSEQPFGEEFFIYAHSLLSQKGVKKQEILIIDFEATKAFFATNSHSSLPFDIFAASFYLVSRYEEYLPFIGDKYGRFPAEDSLAHKNNFLHQPVVDIWALKLKEIMKSRFPEFSFPERKFTFTPTIDVDSAYAYLNKGLIRILGGYFKSIKSMDLETLVDRTKVLFGRKVDPFDTFEWQFEVQKKYDFNPIYFLLVGDYDEYDKNVSLQTKAFHTLIKSISDNAEVGIHPSYASNFNIEKLKKEISRLSAVLKMEIKKSRQHFLKIELPGTYHHLMELDITDDYTMGYASQIGFRAGISSPFYFYNLDQELITTLKVHPFCMMDATLQYYLNLMPDEAISRIQQLMKGVKDVNGTFVSLWHNNSFCEEKEWKGWRRVYEETIKSANNS